MCFQFLKGYCAACINCGSRLYVDRILSLCPKYNRNCLEGRAVRGYILAYEALSRIRWRLFREWLEKKDDKTLCAVGPEAKCFS